LSIKENIDKIRGNIPEGIKLVAVSKTHSDEEMKIAYGEGIKDFGENKVQEFLEKYEIMPSDIRWHIIGHLQRNKVKYIAGKVFLIHSLDSIKLLEELEKQYSTINQTAATLIQLNIGREESKTGIFLENLDTLLEAVENCSFVKVKGLMAIIPFSDEDTCRRYFRDMKSIWDRLKARDFKNINMEYLSMGMTNDYKLAISEGANVIRIGEGIFGKRVYNNIT
jgi:PLP dependent protein